MKHQSLSNFNEVGGTHLQGEMLIRYDSLVHLFGKPLNGDGYKTQAEWVIKFEDGTIATIYDWKVGACYVGEDEGIPAEEVTEWHIGGRDLHAYNLMVETCKDHLFNGN